MLFAIVYAEFNHYWSISYAEIKATEGMVPFVSAFKHVSPCVLFSLVRRKRMVDITEVHGCIRV